MWASLSNSFGASGYRYAYNYDGSSYGLLNTPIEMLSGDVLSQEVVMPSVSADGYLFHDGTNGVYITGGNWTFSGGTLEVGGSSVTSGDAAVFDGEAISVAFTATESVTFSRVGSDNSGLNIWDNPIYNIKHIRNGETPHYWPTNEGTGDIVHDLKGRDAPNYQGLYYGVFDTPIQLLDGDRLKFKMQFPDAVVAGANKSIIKRDNTDNSSWLVLGTDGLFMGSAAAVATIDIYLDGVIFDTSNSYPTDGKVRNVEIVYNSIPTKPTIVEITSSGGAATRYTSFIYDIQIIRNGEPIHDIPCNEGEGDKCWDTVVQDELVVNGEFDSNVDGWYRRDNTLMTWVDGEARVTYGGGVMQVYQNLTLPTGIYRVTCMAKSDSPIRVQVFTQKSGDDYAITGTESNVLGSDYSYYSFDINVDYGYSTKLGVYGENPESGESFVFDNISIKRAPANLTLTSADAWEGLTDITLQSFTEPQWEIIQDNTATPAPVYMPANTWVNLTSGLTEGLKLIAHNPYAYNVYLTEASEQPAPLQSLASNRTVGLFALRPGETKFLEAGNVGAWAFSFNDTNIIVEQDL